MPEEHSDVYAVRLALSCFRYEAARMEREATIRWVRSRSGWSLEAIAGGSGLSPSTISRLTSMPSTLTLDDVRALRARWRVDGDPATRAAADHVVAHLICDELLSAGLRSGE
ncbi:helix-turn-helix domain-containing protein [Streptomyces kronopolitis]|uniref:helix-turn-helix domain-containing protein n=1 Tax=Streptomyces kronopolitis TaxID=1612435 RepID=UPI0036B0337A